MSLLSNWMHPERAYDKAITSSQPYFTGAVGYQQPIYEQGQGAYGSLKEILDNLMHPEKLTDEWSKNYETSEAAKVASETAKQNGLDALSSMGLLGSTPGINAIQTGTSNIVAADRQKYLDDLMQKYITAAQIGGNIYNTGATAGTNLSNIFTNRGTEVGTAKGQGGIAQQDLFGKILGTGGGIIGSALGGPIGGAIGKGITNKMGWSTGAGA